MTTPTPGFGGGAMTPARRKESAMPDLAQAINADLERILEAFRPVTEAFDDAAKRIAEAYRQQSAGKETTR